MHPSCFDDLARKLSTAGTRREFLRLLVGSPLVGLLASWLVEETEAGRRSRRARHQSRRDKNKSRVKSHGKRNKGKDNGRKKNEKDKNKNASRCANAGQMPKKGKRCCQGLVKDGTGRCASPPPGPTSSGCATTCSGCCAGETCITATTNAACGTGGAPCARCTPPQTCGKNAPGVCGCTPNTTCPAPLNCGEIDNGCGTGVIDCGDCTAPYTCGGGTPPVANVCGCTPTCPSNACGGPDGCNGTIPCNTCAGSTPICAGGNTCVKCSAANPCPAGALCQQNGSCISCTVCASGCPFQSVQAAIGGPDETIYICPDTYNETITIAKNLTLIGAGSDIGPGNTILDAQAAGRVVTINRDNLAVPVTVKIRSMRIMGGNAGANPPDGGGIYNDGGSLTLENSVVSQNRASSGGGIYNVEGKVWITSSEVKSNIADGQGGGVYNGFGTVTLGNGTSVTGNEAANPPLEGGSGGGIFNDGGTVTRETGSSVTPNTPDDCIDSGGGCGCPSGNVCT